MLERKMEENAIRGERVQERVRHVFTDVPRQSGEKDHVCFCITDLRR